jgi:hypothetical protein
MSVTYREGVDGKSLISQASPAPGAWHGSQLQGEPRRWLYLLDAAEIEELRVVGARLAASGRPVETLTDADVPLPALVRGISDWMARLRRGDGVVLIRGLPVREMTKQEAACAYWAIGLHMGEAVSQNTAGDRLVDIRDTGADPNSHDTRLYKTRAELTFHTDGADLIGLLCLRAGKSGGISRVCSSAYVHNEVLRRRPDLAPLLQEPFHHHAHGQSGPGGPKTFRHPIATRDGRGFRMFLLLWYIRNAAADFPEIARLSPAQHELLDLLEAIPLEAGAALDMQFQEGDMQFLRNAVILHARTAYEDADAPEEKRHLLRLWLNPPGWNDADEAVRGGVQKRD